MADPGSDHKWPKHIRDRWFFAFLTTSTIAIAWLLSPYFYVLLFAATTVVVTWPVYARILLWVGGRRALASGLTSILLALVVFGPVSLVGYLFSVEAVAVAKQGGELLKEGQLETWTREAQAWVSNPLLSDWAQPWLPEDFDPVQALLGPVQSGLLGLFSSATGTLPSVVNAVVAGSIDVLIFGFAVVTLYMEGPRVLGVARDLSPMDNAYESRLFYVFREFANNMVLGSVATGIVQGLVAGFGYWFVGVERIVFLGILTMVMSFVPLVGTAVVWLPVTLYVGATLGLKWAVGLAIWNLAVTGSVDNVVKPLFLRGSSGIHPLLIFLAVFGGLYWMSLPGVLVGPVLVAFFLALYTIYREDYLGYEKQPFVSSGPGFLGSVMDWIEARRQQAVGDAHPAPSDVQIDPPSEPPSV